MGEEGIAHDIDTDVLAWAMLRTQGYNMLDTIPWLQVAQLALPEVRDPWVG